MKDTPAGTGVAFCVNCGYEATQAEIDAGIDRCPGCQDEGVPAWRKDDVQVKVNWHELRILVIWAEQWASVNRAKNPRMPKIVYGIADRLHLQHLDKPTLSLLGEIAELKAEFGEKNVEVHGLPNGEETL